MTWKRRIPRRWRSVDPTVMGGGNAMWISRAINRIIYSHHPYHLATWILLDQVRRFQPLNIRVALAALIGCVVAVNSGEFSDPMAAAKW